MTFAATENYARIVSRRIAAERVTLAGRWLHRLKELLAVDPNDVFPSQKLLDHIPLLISEIAGYLEAPENEEIAANAAVIAKATELGVLRHEQQASVHQLLREYEILSEILEGFVIDETQRLSLAPVWDESAEVFQRLTRSTRTLMRTTVDTFVAAYTREIQERNERIAMLQRATTHDLRSPLGTLLYAARALETESKGDTVRRERLELLAATVGTTAGRMSLLVQNLQRLANLSAPLDLPSEQLVDSTTIAREVARQLEEMAVSRQVSVRIQSGLPVLYTDPARLELALINLVSNAIKFRDPLKPDPFVEISSTDSDDPEQVTITVRDNGVGIPQECRANIFEPFYRAHPHLDRELEVSGSGLGLAIAHESVRALGGDLRCESVVGTGTTFAIVLPRGSTDGAAPGNPASSTT